LSVFLQHRFHPYDNPAFGCHMKHKPSHSHCTMLRKECHPK